MNISKMPLGFAALPAVFAMISNQGFAAEQPIEQIPKPISYVGTRITTYVAGRKIEGGVVTVNNSDDRQRFVWERPRHVRWVLIKGCGGGGSGALGGFTGYGGGGGEGAPIVTTLFGPLSADSYTIRLGSGGKRIPFPLNGYEYGSDDRKAARGGMTGRDTFIEGSDRSIRFQGGSAGKPPTDGQKAGRVVGDAATWARLQRGAFGGESGTPGGNSMFAPGGEPGPGGPPVRANATEPVTIPYGGGGGGGIGRGGNGGPKGGDGENAVGHCAGGGGSGAFIKDKRSTRTMLSGAGGHGYVVIIPIVDLEHIEARIERLIQLVNDAERDREQAPQ